MATKKDLARIGVAAGIVAGSTAAVAAGLCALVAPRRQTPELDARWRTVCSYRYAHRGLYDMALDVPENSLAAFRRARDAGFGVELDIHLTRDGRLVVIHDSDTARMCGTSLVVEDTDLADLRELRLAGTGERIPTFEEVLSVFDSGEGEPYPPIIVEVKTRGCNADLLCAKTMGLLDTHRVRACVESFDPRVLAWLRRNHPDVIRGQLAENFMAESEVGELALPVRLGATMLAGNAIARPDFVAYRFADVMAGSRPVRLVCDRMGAHLVTWTCRTQAELLASEAMGAPGIFEGFVPSPEARVRM